MNLVQKLIIGRNRNSTALNFMWNMIGSGIYSLVSMMLSVVVIRIIGENDGGVFSIAITVSQMMLYIAYFEQRTYQVTDTENKYDFSQYHGAKIIACVLMMVCSAIYIFFLKSYTIEKSEIIMLMCVYRMLDGYADLYEGQFQLDERLYLAGKSMAFRSIFSASILLLTLSITKNMKMSLCMAIGAAALGVIVFDLAIEKVYCNISPDFNRVKVFNIFRECFPLFIGSFLWVYILSASRIAVDAHLTNTDTAYYQVLFLPVSIINLFATFFFRPELTELSELYNKKNYKLFWGKIKRLIVLIAIFTGITMMGAYFVGIPALSFVSNCDLYDYKGVLVLLMFGGGINAGSFFLYYILTIMRKSGQILFGYISTSILTLVISNWFSDLWGIQGAGLSFCISVIYLFLVFYICFLVNLRCASRVRN